MKLVPGTVAIVTGGARGFGKAFSEALLKRNAKVCFGDVNVTEGKQTENYFQEKYGADSSMFVRCDVTKESECKDLFSATLKKFKKLDLFVNNAGMLNENQWEKTIEVNLIGTLRGSNLAIEHMRKDKGGNGGLIVNVASVGGLYPAFFMPSYIASKFGIVGFTRSWADNPLLESMGLKFACLCPGVSNTDMFSNMEDETEQPLVTFKENKQTIKEYIYGHGINSIDDVRDAFMNLVEKEDNNGAVLTVHKLHGNRYRFTKHPPKM